ncbi:MAG: hypothetical protein AB7F65_03470 [Dehalococcoidia bacterium]
MDPLAMTAGAILFAVGSAFAIFLGIYSARLEARRHAETHLS